MADSGQALKVTFRGEIRRFVVSELDYDSVLKTAGERFAVQPADVKLTYTDSDGDAVTVTSTEELREALREQAPSAGALRLTMIPSNGCPEPGRAWQPQNKGKIAAIVAEVLSAKQTTAPSEGHLLSLLELAMGKSADKDAVLQKLSELTPAEFEKKLDARPKFRNMLARCFHVLCETEESNGSVPRCCSQKRMMACGREEFPLRMDDSSAPISPGSSGKDVLALQKNLAFVGYLQRPPRFWAVCGGVFEGITQDAVARFQRDRNLPLGSVVDDATKLALVQAVEEAKSKAPAEADSGSEDEDGLLPKAEDLVALPAAPLGSDPEHVAALHKALAFAGYLKPRRAHFWTARAGVEGPWTAQALAHMQRDCGIASGCYCEATKEALQRRLEEVKASGERAPKSAMTEEEALLFPPFARRGPKHHRGPRGGHGRGPFHHHHHHGPRHPRWTRMMPEALGAAANAVATDEVPPVPAVDLAMGATGSEVVALHKNLALAGALVRPPQFWANGKAEVFAPYTAKALRALDGSLQGDVLDAAAREALVQQVDKVKAERQSRSLSAIAVGPWLSAPTPAAAAAASSVSALEEARGPLDLASPTLPARGDAALGRMRRRRGAGKGAEVEPVASMEVPVLPQPQPELKRGGVGADVEALQRVLAYCGYLNKPPKFWANKAGKYGGQTEEALRKLQQEQGLAVTGEYTAEVRAALQAKVDKIKADDATTTEDEPEQGKKKPEGKQKPESEGAATATDDDDFVVLKDKAKTPK